MAGSFLNQLYSTLSRINHSSTHYLLAALGGLLSHWTIFFQGEWHLHATLLLKIYLLLYIDVLLAEIVVRRLPWIQGLNETSSLLVIYATSLWGSMLMYRFFFHPLQHFPGPPLARVSKLWQVYRCLDSKNHRLLERLYAQYGSFIRTGLRSRLTFAEFRS